jgi:hypothetical protein
MPLFKATMDVVFSVDDLDDAQAISTPLFKIMELLAKEIPGGAIVMFTISQQREEKKEDKPDLNVN